MIEKLPFETKETEYEGKIWTTTTHTNPYDMQEKINELVDAVNGILAQQEQYATVYKEEVLPMLTPQNEKPADPYAEQRKWIGKLCRVETGGEYRYGILKDVSASHPTHPFNVDGLFFRVCEPVKPDDDIIYKKD